MEPFWAGGDKAEAAERNVLAGVNKTFRSLDTEYKQYNAYTRLSVKSKLDCDRYLKVIEAAWADDPVRDLDAVIAQSAIDRYQTTPASGRYFRSVLSKLVAFGVPRGYSTGNPVEHTEAIDYDPQPYKPWPDWPSSSFSSSPGSACTCRSMPLSTPASARSTS